MCIFHAYNTSIYLYTLGEFNIKILFVLAVVSPPVERRPDPRLEQRVFAFPHGQRRRRGVVGVVLFYVYFVFGCVVGSSSTCLLCLGIHTYACGIVGPDACVLCWACGGIVVDADTCKWTTTTPSVFTHTIYIYSMSITSPAPGETPQI